MNDYHSLVLFLLFFLVTEGVFLYKRGINPYDGDIFHETPVGLVVFNYMLTYLPNALGLLFVACDMLTAYALYTTAQTYVREMVSHFILVKENVL